MHGWRQVLPVSLLLACLAGCGGGGEAPVFDRAASRKAIEAAVTSCSEALAASANDELMALLAEDVEIGDPDGSACVRGGGVGDAVTQLRSTLVGATVEAEVEDVAFLSKRLAIVHVRQRFATADGAAGEVAGVRLMAQDDDGAWRIRVLEDTSVPVEMPTYQDRFERVVLGTPPMGIGRPLLEDGAPLGAEDEQHIRALIDEVTTALAAGAGRDEAELFTSDAEYRSGSGAHRARGRLQVAQMLGRLSRNGAALNIELEHMVVVGLNVAVAHLGGAVEMEDGGNALPVRTLFIMTHDSDGQWRVRLLANTLVAP